MIRARERNRGCWEAGRERCLWNPWLSPWRQPIVPRHECGEGFRLDLQKRSRFVPDRHGVGLDIQPSIERRNPISGGSAERLVQARGKTVQRHAPVSDGTSEPVAQDRRQIPPGQRVGAAHIQVTADGLRDTRGRDDELSQGLMRQP